MNWPRLRESVRMFFKKPTEGKPLSALRIAIGLMMAVQAISLFPHVQELYSQFGLLQADLMETLTGVAIPGFLLKHGIGPDLYSKILVPFYGLHLMLALLFMLGFKTRPTTVLLWITQTVIVNSGYFSSYGVDRYTQNLLFLMIFFPVANVWSVDSWLSPNREKKADCTLGLRLCQLFILMTYISAGASKSLGADWWNGEAIWRVLNQPEFRQFDFLWLMNYGWLVKGLCWTTMVLETFYFIGVWIPYVGRLWVLSIIGMHLGIALTMGLQLFGVTLALVSVALFLVPDSRDGDEPRKTSLVGSLSPQQARS